MHSSDLLGLATELLRVVLAFDAPADASVAAFCRAHPRLGARERHALAETVFAVLRRKLWFEHLAREGSGPIERRLALLGWPTGEDVAPLDAALAPQEAHWLARARVDDPADAPEPLRHNLPDWLIAALKAQQGDATSFDALAASLGEPAPLDVRVNVMKLRREQAAAALAEHDIISRATGWSPWGLRLQGKPALQRLSLYERGEIEVQDEGSQLLALLTGARRGEMVADFCAGAGGKTLALGAMMRDTGRLYAFDVAEHRLQALKERLLRSGLTNVHPARIAADGRDDRLDRLAGKIDRVLVDAPCSGLGTLRRNPDLKWRQTPASVQALCAQQHAILARAARLVKPGGRLIYASCSLLAAEGEDVARAFDVEHRAAGFVPLPVLDALRAAKVAQADHLVQGPYMRLWPHRHATDGFFAALWQRQ